MFSLRDTLLNRIANKTLPRAYTINMGIGVLLGHGPASITSLLNSPCPESVVIHFKSLLAINNNINQFFDTQFLAMQRLYSEGAVAALRGTTEDLSGNPALAALVVLDIGNCPFSGTLTNEQRDLYANRNNVLANEVVVYLVQSMVNITAATSALGCATQQVGRGPGAAVIQNAAQWLVAHEVGHLLSLQHVVGVSDNLMFPNVGWTNLPPDLSASQYTNMLNSSLTIPC
jgi:hypothetical protein